MEVFTAEEQPLLIPLPPIRFELAELRKARVGPNYHIQVEGCFYSVPARLIGKSLDVRITSKVVEAFDSSERIACHPKIAAKGRYQTSLNTCPQHTGRNLRTGIRSASPTGRTRSALTRWP